MNETPQITIRKLRNRVTQSRFQQSYVSLVVETGAELIYDELLHLLKSAIIFLNYGDESMQKLGYRIILRYSTRFNDYKPLYDVAINKGYIPVSKFIETKHFGELNPDGFFQNYFSSYQDNFYQNGIYLSYGQKKLIGFSQDTEGDFVLIAPTSYG
ncbi:MAG: hypothetical protein EOO85_29025, partial [Pedobacter sp.]